jgi:ASC-1-like (ASCH) protein
MKTHVMKLSDRPFNAIATGTKTIESRLYDAKRQEISIGDEIIFAHAEKPEVQVKVRVVGLLRYQTFEDMFTRNSPQKFGGKSVAELLSQISQFYSSSDQKRLGVIGIELALIV